MSIRSSSIDMYKKHGISKLIDIKSITLSDLINKLFKEVVFEYHAYAVHRPIAELINTMSKDFNCQTINEDFFRKFFSDYSRDQLGLIRCVKRS